MVVGVLKLSLVIPENHSLKGKRGVLKRIEARVSNQFNISVTECGDQDLWQSAILGFGVVGSSQPVVQATLQKVVDFVDDMGLAELGDSQVEFFYC
ncbi:MAG: DUF503 domain-containing protein [Deltaproteobacteria bacterium]|jgi:hypothetical protein|nr:DUF503 domain-containing protein [Deltaproteobacteria bacterium]MBI2231001.1 DUF503 domain-containing protein [Deltaproteobacteria bacterium]MBI3064105.1 DUF503 domain-containing protein [Deltaproteobacteria bacterium]HXK28192.1 DUF503 domain-containing protein [Candidatus Binatia bacterium]